MKICVISSTVFPVGQGGLQGYGGLEQIAWQVAKGLAARGHQTSLVAPDNSSCPGVQMIHSGPAGRNEEQAYQRYWKALVEYDVVIDHSWMKFAYCLKAEGVLKAPVLGVSHAPVNTMYQGWPPRFDFPEVGIKEVEKACPVCISKDQAAHFEALFQRPARVAYNGVDVDFYKTLDIPRSKRFLFLGRFSTVKSPLLAIEACLKAGVGLDLIGDTSITKEPEYFQKCVALADGEQIRIVGGIPRGQTVWWYSQAHAMLHPIRDFREPFGLAPVEAMLCGCPVIAWDNGAMRETVKEGGTGFLVRNVDALKDLLTSPWMENIGPNRRESCREWASQFSEENMVIGYEKLCQEALDTGGW